MVQCWWLQELVEIRGVCWQRWCSAGGWRKWGVEFFFIGEKDKYMIFFAYNKPIYNRSKNTGFEWF
jgi:hypothetical protein